MLRSFGRALVRITLFLFATAGGLSERPACGQVPGLGVRLIDVGGSTIDTTSDALDVALNLGGTLKPYRVDRDLTAVMPSVNLGDVGTFGGGHSYPGGYGLAGDESDFVVVASANVTIPAGRWQIAFGSDDGGSLTLGCVSFFGEFGESGPLPVTFPGDDSLLFEEPRGHQWTGGSFILDEPLTTTLSGVFFERGGLDSFEIAIRSASTDTQPSVTPAGGWRILQDGALDWQVSTNVQPGRRVGGQTLIGGEDLLKLQLQNSVEGDPVQQPGLFAEVYRGNLDSTADWDAMLLEQPFPRSQGVIPNINWANDNAGIADAGYPSAFGFENPSNQEFYSVRAQGELFIPQSGVVRFKDGNDDYAFLAIDLDGNGTIDSATETLIHDDGASGPAGQNSPIAVANFSNVAIGGEFRRIDFRMAEDGGFDNGVLYWDQNVGGPAFPTSPGTAASPEHLVPSTAFRTTVAPTLSGELVAALDPGMPLVFDIDAGALTADQIGLPANPDPGRYQNVLNLDGANLVVELLSGTLEPGQRFDLIDETNIDAIRGIPTFHFPFGEWDTSTFNSDGQIAFVSGGIEPPDRPETTWVKLDGGSWSVVGNWDAGVPDGPGDIAIIGGGAPATPATIMLDVPAAIEAIHYNNSNIVQIAGTETLSFLAAQPGATRVVLGSSAGSLDISAPLDFSSGALSIQVERPTSELHLGGRISQQSSALIKEGAGRLVITGNNEDWGGALHINGGLVQVLHPRALGASEAPSIVSGGTLLLEVASAEPIHIESGTLVLNDTTSPHTGSLRVHEGTLSSTAFGDLTFAGELVLTDGGTARINSIRRAEITLSGGVTGTGDMHFASAGFVYIADQPLAHTGNVILDMGRARTTFHVANTYSGETGSIRGSYLWTCPAAWGLLTLQQSSMEGIFEFPEMIRNQSTS